MIVVADTGPLISLAVIDQLDLLNVLFGKVVIPEAVWHELEKHLTSLSLPRLQDFQNHVVPISQPISVLANFGLGEQEAIQLFDEIHGDLLLVEDQGARELAETRGIPCTGLWVFSWKRKGMDLLTHYVLFLWRCWQKGGFLQSSY